MTGVEITWRENQNAKRLPTQVLKVCSSEWSQQRAHASMVNPNMSQSLITSAA